MERPQVRLVQSQQVETTVREVGGYEAEELLRKYGHNSQFSTRQEDVPVDNGLSFEEMLISQQTKEKYEKERKQQQINGPKPITFQSRQYDTEVKYGSDDELGFGFKIEIISDMRLPKY